MPRDSAGNYTLPAGNPVVTDTIIEAIWANATMPDLGAEITNSLDRQGRGSMLAQLKILDGSVSVPGIAFNSELNTGFYWLANRLYMGLNGIAKARLDSSALLQVLQGADWRAVAPQTTKGDVVVASDTDNVRVPVGLDGQSLVADSADGLGVRWGILNNYSAITDPTVGDDSDSNYEVGSSWVNTAENRVFVCADATVGAAVWDPGGRGYVQSDVTPASPEDTSGWWDTETGDAYRYYDNAGNPVFVQEDPDRIANSESFVLSVQENSSGTKIVNILALTQAEYDALTPLTDTVYFIV